MNFPLGIVDNRLDPAIVMEREMKRLREGEREREREKERERER